MRVGIVLQKLEESTLKPQEEVLAEMPVNCTEDLIVDLPVAQCQDDTVEVVLIPQERIADEPINANIVKVAQIMYDCTEEQIVDIPDPQCQEDIVQAITDIRQERIGERIL